MRKTKNQKSRILYLMEKYENEEMYILHNIYEEEKKASHPDLAIAF
ncbi:MAG: hypothetical protein QXG00_04750 [Candidatus Woesearchaeota archaeon]